MHLGGACKVRMRCIDKVHTRILKGFQAIFLCTYAPISLQSKKKITNPSKKKILLLGQGA